MARPKKATHCWLIRASNDGDFDVSWFNGRESLLDEVRDMQPGSFRIIEGGAELVMALYLRPADAEDKPAGKPRKARTPKPTITVKGADGEVIK